MDQPDNAILPEEGFAPTTTALVVAIVASVLIAGGLVYFWQHGLVTAANQDTASADAKAQKLNTQVIALEAQPGLASDETLILNQARAHYDAVIITKPAKKLDHYLIYKREGNFATVIASQPDGTTITTYLAKVNGTWTYIAAGDNIIDKDFRAKYGLPADY